MSYELYRGEQTMKGLEFQDFVTLKFMERGIALNMFCSRRYQFERGESLAGVEVKRDDGFRNTGNLYMECDEKAHPDRPSFTPSGIAKLDNAWLYAVGDEKKFWVFSKRHLLTICKQKRYLRVAARAGGAESGHGYLMPLADADKYCVMFWDGKWRHDPL